MQESNPAISNLPEGVILVPAVYHGNHIADVQIAQSDYDLLKQRGWTAGLRFNPRRMDNVCAVREDGWTLPVAVILMNPGYHQWVEYKDGDITNLTRDNLSLRPKKTVEYLRKS